MNNKVDTTAAAGSVIADEGIVIKRKRNHPETDRNLKKSVKKTGDLRNGTDSNGFMNIANIPAPLIPFSMSTLRTRTSESLRGKFGFVEINKIDVPFILRIIDNKDEKFIPLRIAAKKLFESKLKRLHSDIQSYITLKCYVITKIEEKLLNDINQNHSKNIYGQELFVASKDYIVSLEDVKECCDFINVCFKKLQCRKLERRNPCGFIRINYETFVPYIIYDEKKYVPLFYFEGKTENLRHSAVKLENWGLAYLKFCCRILNIKKEIFSGNFCLVVCFDDIKCIYPPETDFKDFWPANVINTGLITKHNFSSVSLLNNVSAPESNLQQNYPVPAPSNMQLLTNDTNQNGSSSKFTGYFVFLQTGGLMNNACQVELPPLTCSRASITNVVGNGVSYSNNLPTNQTATTNTYNPMSHTQFSSNEPNNGIIYTLQRGPFIDAAQAIQPYEIFSVELPPSSTRI